MSGLAASARYNKLPIASCYGALHGLWSSCIFSGFLFYLFFTCPVTIGIIVGLHFFMLNFWSTFSIYSDCFSVMILFLRSLFISMPKYILDSSKSIISKLSRREVSISWSFSELLLASEMSSTYKTRNVTTPCFFRVNKQGLLMSLSNPSSLTSSANLWFHLLRLTFRPYRAFLSLHTFVSLISWL